MSLRIGVIAVLAAVLAAPALAQQAPATAQQAQAPNIGAPVLGYSLQQERDSALAVASLGGYIVKQTIAGKVHYQALTPDEFNLFVAHLVLTGQLDPKKIADFAALAREDTQANSKELDAARKAEIEAAAQAKWLDAFGEERETWEIKQGAYIEGLAEGRRQALGQPLPPTEKAARDGESRYQWEVRQEAYIRGQADGRAQEEKRRSEERRVVANENAAQRAMGIVQAAQSNPGIRVVAAGVTGGASGAASPRPTVNGAIAPPNLPPSAPAASIQEWMTGEFDSGGGLMKLTPAGGTYQASNGRMTVTSISGTTVEGTWEQDASGQRCADGTYRGKFRLFFKEDSFTGLFGYCEEPPAASGGFWGNKRQPPPK